MKKWIVRIVIGLVVLAVIAVVCVVLFLNSIVKTGFETIGPKLTKVEMKLEKANLSPFSGAGQLTGMSIGNPEGFKTPTAIKVGDVKVAVNVSSLSSDVIQIEEINIQSPEITYELGLSGSNLGKILDNLNACASGESKPEDKTEKPASKKNVYIKNVVVNGGKINLSVTGMAGSAVPIPLPNIHLENIGTKEKGVSMAQASKQIMEAIVTSVTKVASESGNAITTGAKEGATKVMDNIKGLFKK